MSLGSTYNNNKNTNRAPDPTVYSNYRMNNAESSIDQTCLTFKYWKTNLCISISPRKQTGNDEVQFDMDNGITIYLSHTKARILKAEIENFLTDPIKYNGVGVPSGSAAITISNGVEYGKNTPVLTIRKVDESGNVVASFAYEFKSDYHYSIRNYDGRNFVAEYNDYKHIEIEQLVTVLDQYIQHSTKAAAFFVHEQGNYGAYRMENKIDAIAASLGVEIPKAGGRKPYSNNSYFNNNNSTNNSSGYSSGVSYGAATIDDLE